MSCIHEPLKFLQEINGSTLISGGKGGKRDEDLILPINDSLSATLSTDQLCAKTTVAAGGNFKEHKMWLNGKEVPFDSNKRILRCLDELKRIAGKKSPRFPLDWKLHVCSENNFPTAAGLASSAAGYACLVYTIASLYGIENEELSCVARLGSGSACRSMCGGFVQWLKGNNSNGTDSIAEQIQPASHWPEMRVLILVVNDSKKKTSSTSGMQTSVETSELINFRAEMCVPSKIEKMKEAILNKNFETFGEITMKDSNQFHAVCLDTYPPCVYMNDVSHAISNFIHQYNEARGGIKVAYTFDAGPNACLYLLEDEVPSILAAINKILPNDNSSSVEYVKGIPVDLQDALPLESIFENIPSQIGNNLLKYIIHTKVGNGPKKLGQSDSLLNENGLPK